MFLRIHWVECIDRMHAKAGYHTPKIEYRTNQTVLLHKFVAKMTSNLPCVKKFHSKFLPVGVPDVFVHSFVWMHWSNTCKNWWPHSKNWMQDKPNCFVVQIHCENGIKVTLCSKVSHQIFPGWSGWCFCAFIWINAFIECMQKLIAELCILRLHGTHEHKPVQSWIQAKVKTTISSVLKQKILVIF